MSAINEVGSVPLAPLERPESPSAAGGSDFMSSLGDAISGVDNLEKAADQQSTALAEGAGNLHETTIALSKAEVGMHLLMQVRNKVVAAYQDIMKMSI